MSLLMMLLSVMAVSFVTPVITYTSLMDSALSVLMQVLTPTVMLVLLNVSIFPLVKFRVLLLVNQAFATVLLVPKLVMIGSSPLNLVSLLLVLTVILSLFVLDLLKVALISVLPLPVLLLPLPSLKVALLVLPLLLQVVPQITSYLLLHIK